MNQEKLWNKYYILTLLVNTLHAFSFYMIATILSKYLVGIGTTVTMAGFIVGLVSLTSLVCRPFSGVMADRLNNVTLLKWSTVLMGIGLLGFTITTEIPLLIFFRIINGVGFALAGTCQIALASHYIPKTRMGEGIGYFGLGMVIGSAVAPGIGLAIAESVGMRVTFLISAVMVAGEFVILMFLHEEKKKTVEKIRIHLRDIVCVEALPFTLVAGSYSFINGIIASYLVLYADEVGVGGVSVYFTVCAVVLFIVRPFSGKLMDKKGIRVAVVPGLILTACSMFILGVSRTLPLILLTGVIRSLGQGAAQPALQAGCINEVGIDRSGVATSTYYLGGDIFQGIGPMIGGFIVEAIAGAAGYTAIFAICGIFQLCALGYFVFVTGRKKAEKKQAAGSEMA
ncbi:MFS transporter [Lachnoclostridium sp. An169]|uniref:MFS transporter n=1 Tax=Lachnoclostridium sp. An169 TaxID=1965569 RepID=UPI000B39B373|nr:MFS transporter [Lachnoclostridium sp. An169]HJA64754.1 MFS transporter [Candidatus Mediterraneibacter cottocaccae]